MGTTMLVPPWLEPLLKAAFFSACQNHEDSCRSEKNMYCLECNDDSFCSICRTSKHKDHQVIQIRRSSYHDVVRVSEIQKMLDINGVQSYVINSARVMFLNERPQPKTQQQPISVHNYNYVCHVCGRTLLDTFTFCSLGCKLAGMKRNGNASFNTTGQINEVLTERRRRRKGMSQSRRRRRGDTEGSRQDMVYPPPSSSSSTQPPPLPSSSTTTTTTTKRRKGIPHRAPFGCPI